MRETLLRRCQEGSLRSSSAVKKPHFFRIIHPALLRDGKLVEFPKRFVRKYGKNLSSSILLKTPSGAEWPVQLVKRDDEVSLQDGWQKFADYYSIGYGHFLVFRYEGKSIFHVLIFDRTASEIEYPSTNATHDEDQPNNNNGVCQCPDSEENRDDVSFELLDDFPASQTAKKKDVVNISSSEEEMNFVNEAIRLPQTEEIKGDVSVGMSEGFPPIQETRKKRKSSSLPSMKKRRRNPSRKTDSPFNLQSFCQRFESEGIQASGRQFEKLKTDLHLSKYMEGGGGMPTTKRCKQYSEVLPPSAARKEDEALRRAKAFKSENPFFIVTMQPTYVTTRYNLNIPMPFFKRHFKKDTNIAALSVPEGGTWPAKYNVGKTDVKISSGWKKFAVDNRLKVGDVCALEMIKSTGTSLKVVIFRKDEGANGRMLQRE